MKRRDELLPDRDASGRLLPWVIAVMVFVATLSLGGALALSQASARWLDELASGLTAQVAAEPPESFEQRVSDTIAFLDARSEIAEVRRLSESEMMELIKPWLGTVEGAVDLPVPQLIDVRVREGAEIDLAPVAEELAKAVPGSALELHRTWLAPLVALTQTLQWLGVGIVALIALATVAIVIFTTRAGLVVHREVVELLHMIGAQDAFIAREFQHHALKLALRGSLIGIVVGVAMLVVVEHFGAALQAPLLPSLKMGITTWVALAILPASATLIATLTARITVLRHLARIM